MKQFDVKEYNKMCAEFLGGIEYIPKPWYYFPIHQRHWFFPNRLEPNRFVAKMLKFDTDWNWIMEVVEKIEAIEKIKGDNESTVYRFDICNKAVKIDTCNDEIVWTKQKTKKEAVVQAIWEFLNWYKTQTT